MSTQPQFVIRYTLELLEPLLVTSLEGDPNAKRSLDYLPGSVMRGALIGQYLQRHGHAQLEPENEKRGDERQLFLSDSTCFLNAYPEIRIDNAAVRTLPTPLSLQKEKHAQLKEPLSIVDVAEPEADEDKEMNDNSQNSSLKPVGKPFSHINKKSIYLYAPGRSVNIHTARERRAGRATSAAGAVFRYEALAPRQRLQGIILTGSVEAASQLCDLLDVGDLWLGGSRTAGYGHVSVTCSAPKSWSGETQPASDVVDLGERLVITCLSHLLLTNEWGESTLDLDAARIIRLLQVDSDALTLCDEQSVRKMQVVGGFNRTWGLPLPQRQAIAAGSVFVFNVNKTIPAAVLQQLQLHGIGEACNDGFGRIAINWQSSNSLAFQELGSAFPDSVPPIEKQAHRQLAGEMLLRILHRQMDEKLIEYVNNRTLVGPPSNSLLTRLRMKIRESISIFESNKLDSATQDNYEQLSEKVLKPIQDLLTSLKQPAQDQLKRARIQPGNQRFNLWLEQRVQKAAGIWQELGVEERKSLGLGSFTQDIPPSWCLEYTLRLIEALLHKMEKSNRATASQHDQKNKEGR